MATYREDGDAKPKTKIVPPEVQLSTEPAGEEKPPSEEPSQEPVTEEQVPEIDPRFEGKSREDMVTDYTNLESHAGRLAQQVDELKRKAESVPQQQPTQNQPQWGQQPTGIQTPPEPEVPNLDDEFIDNPSKAAATITDERLKKFRQEQRYAMAFNLAPTAKTQAKTMYPGVFEGVDDQEVEQFMYGSVQSGYLQPEVMSSPDGWRMIAWELKGRKSNFTTKPASPIPTSPITTETPAQAKPQVSAEHVPQAPAGWDELWDKMNVSSEARKRILQKQGGKK